MSSTDKIVLKSSDEQTFEVDETVARQLQIISHMIDDDCAGKAIPLQNVTGNILAIVIEYCTKHVETGSVENESEEKEKEEEKNKKLDDWDAEFMKQYDIDTVFKLIAAANYLNTKSLLSLSCQTVADFIKDKTVEEVREIFNIENDFTPEEEAAVRKENEWAFESDSKKP